MDLKNFEKTKQICAAKCFLLLKLLHQLMRARMYLATSVSCLAIY